MLKHQRHELFLREYFANGWNGERAYMKVYGPVKTAKVQASKLLAKPKVRKRFNQMINRLIKRADITEEKILTQYQEAYDMAKVSEKTADMIAASTAQAKLVGMLRDRLEAGSPGDFDRMENISDVLDALSRQVGPEIASKIGQALGALPAIEQPPTEDINQLAEAPTATDAIN